MTTSGVMAPKRLAAANNERGAEIVEWVLWVGGIALLAGVIYATVSTALSSKVNTIMNTVLPLSS